MRNGDIYFKVCGMTRREDVEKAAKLGFNYTGFIFHPQSPRFITPEGAAELSLKETDLPQGITVPKRVGVFVNLPADEVSDIYRRAKLDIVQLHGDEDRRFCDELGLPWWKALRIKDESDVDTMARYSGGTVLIDAYRKGVAGGTGKRINRDLVELSVRRAEKESIRLILAGGLNEESVEFLSAFPLWGADFNSGLEISPGIKDHGKMKNLMVRAGKCKEEED